MPFYAQIDSRNFCFAISQLRDEENRHELVPIPNFDEKYMGKKYGSGIFYGLQAVAEGSTVYVSWRDLQGNLVDETEEVRARHGGSETIISMTNGQGSFIIEAPPGTYLIEIFSTSGCRTDVEVTISG